MINKSEKRILLQSLLSGNVSNQQIDNLKKSREPISLTMVLSDELSNSTIYPQFCIDIYEDGTTRCYDRYEDGKERDRIT